MDEREIIMKRLSRLFAALAVVISNVMCFVVAYNYRDMLCGIEHAGYSAPAGTAFLYAVPFAVAVTVCAVLAIRFYRKSE